MFASHLVHLIQTGINFSCPRAPLEFTQNKLLVPPQNLFLHPPPPSHAILAPGLRLQERIKQHVPKALRQRTISTQEQGSHKSQPTTTQPNRKCKAKSKTQFEPESDSAVGQHLLKSKQCARNCSGSWFKTLTTARSQFHLSLLEAAYISRKKNGFEQAKAICICLSTVPIRSGPAVTI